jgi:PhoPQ-activated pathogenicity-related protein
MPKLILAASGDEFFLPDSPQFFINELPGETHLNVPRPLSVRTAKNRGCDGDTERIRPPIVCNAAHSRC